MDDTAKMAAYDDFNPRSREGSDPQRWASPSPDTNFNPRSREGSDVQSAVKALGLPEISIHAPVKGATKLPRWDVGV